MAGPERGDVRHERVGREPVDHVAEEHREGALAVVRREVAERPRIIGLDQLRLHPGEDVEHAPQRQPTALRRHEVLHTVGEGHDPDVVVVLDRRVRQLERRPHHVVEA